MGKGDRKGRRKPPKGVPEIEPAPRKQPNGRRRKRSGHVGERNDTDPKKVALDARCRLFGLEPTKQNRWAMRGQHLDSDVGLVLEWLARLPRRHAEQISRRQLCRLWSCWSGFCAAERTYRLRYLGQSGQPKGQCIEMAPNRLETDQGHTIDDRSAEQRDRDAVNTFMRWRGNIGMLTAQEQFMLLRTEQGNGARLWQNAAPTGVGIETVAALARLADVVEQRS